MDYRTSSDNLNSSWYWLRLFNYYRGILALFFLTIYLNGWAKLFIPPAQFNPSAFFGASVLYVIAFLIFMQTVKRARLGLETQVIIQTCVDIVAIITIMHASGGIGSGIGMLLITNISMTSLFLQRNITFLFAAATSLALLLEQTYSQIIIKDYEPAYIQAGILGILIFLFAFMASYISRRLHETEQLATQQGQELENIVNLNEHIISNMRTGIIVISGENKILMANKAAENLLGNININANTHLEKISPALFERLNEWQASSEPMHQSPVRQSHGLPDIQPGFSSIGSRDNQQGGTLIFLEDASQLNQRFQEVKLASLGRLTASIAHEIRNPLAAIHHASQLLDETASDPELTKLTNIIGTQTQRLNSIVENVLQISRRQRGELENINLKEWLIQFRSEFCASHGMESNQMQIDIKPDTISVLFDSGHLHQIFLNICSNAITHSGVDIKDLTITLKGGITDESLQPFVDIIDNGKGVDKIIESEIFEPFFTTNSKGTGLGLYITKEVIENNRAKIRHITPPEGGNCFRIYFMQAPDDQANKRDYT